MVATLRAILHAIQRAISRKLITAGGAAILAAAGCVSVVGAPSASAATTSITVNGTQGGRTFDGIGAISGGGGNSVLLAGYPAAQQQQIYDYLFKPGYGADLQILKVEIGGDTNSTDGSESSIEHARGTVNCNAGYEWQLMEAAKARNPNIKLYALAWGAPGWIGGGNFWSTDMISYLVSWLGCAASHGLTINYLGGWNERGYNIGWYEQLRSTLNADGYSGVQIVGADTDWTVANDLVSNSAFSQAVQIIGSHYPCGWMTLPDLLPEQRERRSHRQAAVGQRERVAGLQRRGGRDGPGRQPGLPGRGDDRHHQLADRRLDLPGLPVRHRRADPGQPAVVGVVLGRRAGVGHRADHPVHRPGLDLHQLRQRVHRRQREQRQLRHAQVPRRVGLELDHRDHAGIRRRRP